MATTYKTPGVYIQEISKFPPSVAQVETAIPAFIGYTEKAVKRGIDQYDADTPLSNDPIVMRITSLLEYEQFFGGPELATGIEVMAKEGGEISVTVGTPSKHIMYYSLQAFFANGGGPCYIVSVGKTTEDGTIEKAPLEKGINFIEKEDEVTLIVIPESLSLEAADSKALYDEALKQCAKLQDRFVVMDANLNKKDDNDLINVFSAAGAFRSEGIGTDNLKYGAAYGPLIETVFDYAYDEKTVTVNIIFTQPDEEGTIPDAVSPTMYEINPNPEVSAEDTPPPPPEYGQYYPLVKSAIASEPVVLPAAPLVVGIYADVDSTRGVWKAPANVSLKSVVGPTIRISSEEQANLNLDTTGKSINAIRTFAGKGTLIWGARTLAGNDNEWRYVPVRRFFNMAEESIKKATEGFVFEPNDSNTWTKIRAMIENFLTLQWRAGALQGAKPEDSFYVKIGLNETMTALDILEGRLIVEIGMAVVRPAEFIILKFSHKMAQS